MKLYGYKGCGTCRKAINWLDQHSIKYDFIPIREQPPSIKELKTMLKKYPLKKLFNTSGTTYRELNIREKLPSLSEPSALKLLNGNGNLIKRPFVLNEKIALVGFNIEEWEKTLT